MKDVPEDRVQPQPAGDAGAGPGQLLANQDLLQHAPAAAAIRVGDGHVGHPDLARFGRDLHREVRLAVALRRHRQDLPARELTGGVLNQLLLVAQFEVHASLPHETRKRRRNKTKKAGNKIYETLTKSS
jgi:hypothetical protein